VIVGTAGHIDHGKTALVGALSGVDTDRLKEEKARGISIDLGFAYLPTPTDSVIGFVDVPGHEDFVKNMLAGKRNSPGPSPSRPIERTKLPSGEKILTSASWVSRR